MGRLIILSGLVLLNLLSAYGQNSVFAFFEYDIKNGMEDPFANGYAKDLEWHRSQGDDWSWVGWFVLNGDRRGRFIDATPNHDWQDFDTWKVDGAENSRHNKIHWLPYVENPSGSYRKIMEGHSRYAEDWYRSKYLQVYYLHVRNGWEGTLMQYLTRMKPLLEDKLGNKSFVWMKTVSGGDPDTLLLFVALEKIEDLQLCSDLFPGYPSGKEGQEKRVVKEIISELWGYSDKLSLFPDQK